MSVEVMYARKLTAQVVEQAADYESARLELRAAELELLAEVCDTIKPALSPAGSRISLVLTVDAEGAQTEKLEGKERYVVISPSSGPKLIMDEVGEAGHYGGVDALLREDGTPWLLHHGGSFRRGVGGRIESKLVPSSLEELCAQYRFRPLYEQITHRLEQQVQGNRSKLTTRFLLRAERLRALTVLLQVVYPPQR